MSNEESQPIEWFDSEAEFELVQRINRALTDDEEMIWRSEPDSRMEMEYGEYYKIDICINGLVDWQVDIHELARALDALGETANA